MISLPIVIVVAVASAIFASIVAWSLASRRGYRLLEQRAAMTDERDQRERRQAADRHAVDRRDLELARSEEALLRAELEQLRLALETSRDESRAVQRQLQDLTTRLAEVSDARREADLRLRSAVAQAETHLESQLRALDARRTRERQDLETKLALSEAQRADLEHTRRNELALASDRLRASNLDAARIAQAELTTARARAAHELAAAKQQLEGENRVWRRRAETLATICQLHLDAPVPATIFADRPAPSELEAIAGRVRGLAFVDVLTVADSVGLPLGRGGVGRDVDDLAATVPAVARMTQKLHGAIGAVTAVAITTGDARTIEFRALPAWTAGAWLVAQTSAQRPPAAALDAAVALAFLGHGATQPAPVGERYEAFGWLGSGNARSQAMAEELERAGTSLGSCALAIVRGGQVLAGVVKAGPTPDQMDVVAAALHALQRAATATLRSDDLVRIEVDLASGARFALSWLATASRVRILSVHVNDRADVLSVERVAGRLRRFLDDTGSAAAEDAA
jgi:hypothetical protein